MGSVDFDAARKERQAANSPYTFTLGGETFAVKAKVSLGELWVDVPPDAPERFATTATSELGQVLLLTARWIAGRLPLEDSDRWWSIFDPPTDVDADDLFAVMDAITEALTGRPTSPSAGSANGHPTGGSSNGSTSSSKPAKKSGRSSTPARASASRGSNGSPTNGHRKKGGTASSTGSRARTKR